jgi:hypothetical protein
VGGWVLGRSKRLIIPDKALGRLGFRCPRYPEYGLYKDILPNTGKRG